MAAAPPSAVGRALIDFSVNGLFPDDDSVSSAALRPEVLPDAIQALADAKAKLEAEIHTIVEETADDVRAWIANAKALQVDIARRKTLANDILIRADDVPATTNGAEEEQQHDQQLQPTPAEAEAEARARFLTNELNYNLQVRYLLEAIRRVNEVLDQADQASRERRILDALRLLERAWTALDAMPVSKSCRAMRLLDIRAFELKSNVHVVFDHVWSALVRVDAEKGTLTVNETRQDEPMSLSDAVIGLKAYKEVDQRMADLWHQLDSAIVLPRTDLSRPSRPAIFVDDSMLGIRGSAGDGVPALFHDLERLFSFLAAKLPADLVPSISSGMMPGLVARITDVWLASAVPISLDQMETFESTIEAAQAFCATLEALQFSGFGRLQEWIENAPRVWLAKRREAALDTVRTNIARGLGTPQQVEKIEKQMVSRSEGKALAAASGPSAAAATEQAAGWDTAWSDEEEKTAGAEDDGADAWAAWGDDEPADDAAAEAKSEEAQPEAPPPEEESKENGGGDNDDAADAWGWGDEDGGDDEANPPEPAAATKSPAKAKPTSAPETQTREMVMREAYSISSMPGPVLELITSILADAAALTSDGTYKGSPVAAAAAGLFGLPSLALAMFRAVSPYYYALDSSSSGSMYLYNDAMYLAEKLAAATAASGDDADTKSAMPRLDAEVAKLQAFASRAYGREMALQKTVLRDLLGGDQNVLQGSSGSPGGGSDDNDEDADDYVDAAVARVRSMSAAWDGVLAPSAWFQAVGALADAVAQKIIADVLDMPAVSQDDAFGLAKLIQRVTELDDLFLSPQQPGQTPSTLPMTAQYAPSWLRLQYLSEVLQSNLREVRFLWMESELSLYFSAGEVLDLLRASFEDNARSREVAREIAANPHPRPVEW